MFLWSNDNHRLWFLDMCPCLCGWWLDHNPCLNMCWLNCWRIRFLTTSLRWLWILHDEGWGLSMEELSKKLLCFGVDGVNMFQGVKNRVTKQIKDSWAPFSMDVHYVAHHINVACNPWEILLSLLKLRALCWTCMAILAIHQKYI